jgi:hypothetical protein
MLKTIGTESRKAKEGPSPSQQSWSEFGVPGGIGNQEQLPV